MNRTIPRDAWPDISRRSFTRPVEVETAIPFEPAYYAYAYPEPDGFAAADVEPPATWSKTLREWVLPYEEVRRATDPEDTLSRFLQSAWSAAADLGGWDRDTLERPERDLSELERRLLHSL